MNIAFIIIDNSRDHALPNLYYFSADAGEPFAFVSSASGVRLPSMLRSRLSSAFKNPPLRFFPRLGLDGLMLLTRVSPRGRIAGAGEF